MTALSAKSKEMLAVAMKEQCCATEVATGINLVASVTPGTATASKGLVLNSASGATGIGALGMTTANVTNANLGRCQITATAVNAAGTGIGNTTGALSYGLNVVAGADNTAACILPVAVANGVVEVLSTVNAKSLVVFPQVNSAIAGLGANAAATIGPANTAAAAHLQYNYAKFIATNTTQWYVQG